MFSRFFIDRPIFAAVISIIIVIAGLAAIRVLPVGQYPEIAPPVVTVRAVYPGASATTLEQTVAAPLENAINGVEDMLYMSSTSASNGAVEMQVTFNIGADVDKAALNVNNRVKQAEARLPLEVRRQGVTVEKGSSAFLQVIAFSSPDSRFDGLFISNYVTLNVLDQLKRIPGTTNVQIFGAKDYAMRIWLKPDRLSRSSSPPPRWRRRSPSRTRIRRRPDRPGADERDARARLHRHHQGTARRGGGVREHRRAREPGRLEPAAEGRRPGRARLEGLRVHRPRERARGDARRHLPAAGR
jgi:hypothetical protein